MARFQFRYPQTRLFFLAERLDLPRGVFRLSPLRDAKAPCNSLSNITTGPRIRFPG